MILPNNLIRITGDGEMAHLVTCSICKHEDLSFQPSYSCKNAGHISRLSSIIQAGRDTVSQGPGVIGHISV